jgi:hypothetical protein
MRRTALIGIALCWAGCGGLALDEQDESPEAWGQAQQAQKKQAGQDLDDYCIDLLLRCVDAIPDTVSTRERNRRIDVCWGQFLSCRVVDLDDEREVEIDRTKFSTREVDDVASSSSAGVNRE